VGIWEGHGCPSRSAPSAGPVPGPGLIPRGYAPAPPLLGPN
jgi:hypothetical protein